MMFKSLVPMAVLAMGVLGADSSSASVTKSSDGCSFDGETMTEAASISELASCETLDGTLEISGDEISSLDLSGVEEIAGDIHIFNSSSCTNINLNELEKISGKLSVDALTQLHVIDFTKLSNIDTLNLISLPSLSSLNLNSGVSKLKNLQISDTALGSLQGLVTSLNTLGQLNVNNNKNITSIDLSSLNTVQENLILSFNGESCEISLDSLEWASNMTIQDAGSLLASSLSRVNGSLTLGYNKFETFELPVEKTGGLQIFAHDYLTEFSLGNLTEIDGELEVFNNTELDDMSESFKDLESIQGAVNIRGSFSNLTMPSLEEVGGDFLIRSDNSDFDCKAFKKLHSNDKIEGHNFKCVAPKKDASGSASGSSGSFETETFSGSDSGSSDSSDDSDDSSSSSEDSANTIIGSGIIAIVFSTVLSVLI